MELLATNAHFIVVNGTISLYCDRLSGKFSIRDSTSIGKEWNPVCLGKVDGLVGKIRYYPDTTWKLYLIQDSEHIGFLPDGMEVRRIKQVCTVALNTTPVTSTTLKPCEKIHPEIEKLVPPESNSDAIRKPLYKRVQKRIQNAAGIVDDKLTQRRQRVKYERRIHEELVRLLQAEDSFFYFSPNGDITSWTQRKYSPSYLTGVQSLCDVSESSSSSPFTQDTPRQPSWRRVDARFFWNEHLLSEAVVAADNMLTSIGFPSYGSPFPAGFNWKEFSPTISDLESLIFPIVQGFVEIERVDMASIFHSQLSTASLSSIKSTPSSVFYTKSANASPVPRKHMFLDDKRDTALPTHRDASNTSLNRTRTGSKDRNDPTFSEVGTPSDSVPKETPKQFLPLKETEILFVIMSRRSRHRAGTQYRRRGIDINGHVANYVETEQILHIGATKYPQTMAILQIRGSVPLFWSQTGLRYRPPISLDKDDNENQRAFSEHWKELLSIFEHVIVVNLLDCGVKRSENLLLEAFTRHLLLLNNEQLTCILFDFHEYCRGLHFENASILLSGTVRLLREMKFCWVGMGGLLCSQRSVFRINCLDCLDRTNLVQCLFAGAVLTIQLKKLGLLGPEDSLPTKIMRLVQRMWANNGDAISQQYAGTVAMKGDFTRTGERTMNGLVRDGVSSMNRYYLRLNEIARQATIDLLLGYDESQELRLIRNGAGTEAASIQAKEESLRQWVLRCHQILLGTNETSLSDCLLISCSGIPAEAQYVNTVLVITDKYLHFVRLDASPRSRRPCYIRLPVESLVKLELGLEPTVFRSRHHVLRIHYSPTSSIFYTSDSTSDYTSLSSPVIGTTRPLNDRVTHPTQYVAPSDSESTGSATSSDGQLNRTPPNTTQPRKRPSAPLSKYQLAQHYYLDFLHPNVRLFNTMFVPVAPGDENLESLRVVAAVISVAAKNAGRTLEIKEHPAGTKLQRIREIPVPQTYRPQELAKKLFADRRSLLRLRRNSRRSSRNPPILTDDAQHPSASMQDTKSLGSSDSGSAQTPTGLDKIRQRFNQIKLPSIRLKMAGTSPEPTPPLAPSTNLPHPNPSILDTIRSSAVVSGTSRLLNSMRQTAAATTESPPNLSSKITESTVSSTEPTRGLNGPLTPTMSENEPTTDDVFVNKQDIIFGVELTSDFEASESDDSLADEDTRKLDDDGVRVEDEERFSAVGKNQILMSCEFGKFTVSDVESQQQKPPTSKLVEPRDIQSALEDVETVEQRHDEHGMLGLDLAHPSVKIMKPAYRRLWRSDTNLTAPKSTKPMPKKLFRTVSSLTMNLATKHDLDTIDTMLHIRPSSAGPNIILFPVMLRNVKMTERLRQKQMDTALWLNGLQHEVHPDTPIQTSFIVF